MASLSSIPLKTVLLVFIFLVFILNIAARFLYPTLDPSTANWTLAVSSLVFAALFIYYKFIYNPEPLSLFEELTQNKAVAYILSYIQANPQVISQITKQL